MALTVAGRLVPDPVDIWRRYASRTRTLYEYDLAGAGVPTVLVEGEVTRTRVIASRISRPEIAWFLQRAADAPWSGVNPEADLEGADPADQGGLFDKAAELYWHFTSPHEPGISWAKIHKVLHVKRPRLYPVLDRLVRRLYSADARRWVNRIPDTRLGDSVTFWAAIRQDVINKDNRSALVDHRGELRAEPQTAPMADLPSVRLLDIVAWETARRECHRPGFDEPGQSP